MQESKSDEKCRNYDHDEHDCAETDVDEEPQECGCVLFLVNCNTGESIYLSETDQANRYAGDDGKVAVGPACRFDVEETIISVPHSLGK